MRLHALQVTAFGPFPGTEHVDFDSLNDAGLFLLSGATGAGKTSILDAVCFALYGSVPGARGVKALRSQHADDHTPPEVVLDFSVRERRFVVRRSPEWSRPKKRGSGTRTAPASASLTEVTGDAGDTGHLLSHRAAEVGLIVSELIGMQAAQFWQVAMLPQGEFQRFLQATSAERHGVLQHLFQTARFAHIEDWVHEHSMRLREETADGERAVLRLLATIADRSGTEPPGEAGQPVDARACLAWAQGQVAAAEQQLATAAAQSRQAAAAAAAARQDRDQARQTAELVARRDRARAGLAGLQRAAPRAAELEQSLAADAAAAGCTPVLHLLAQAEDDLAALRTDLDRAHATAELDEHTDLDELTGLERDTRSLLARLETAVPALERLADAEAALADDEAELSSLRTERDAVRDLLESVPARRRELEALLGSARTDAGRVDGLTLRATAAAARRDAAAAVPGLEAELLSCREAHNDARDAEAAARERVQVLAQRRLDGFAAELAGALQDGQPCQVCGSPDHPAPADPLPGQVSAAEQEQAQVALEEAAAESSRRGEQVDDCRQRLLRAREGSDGLSPDAAAQQHADAAAERDQAARSAAGVPDLESELADLARRSGELQDRSSGLDRSAAGLTESIQARRASAASTRAELARLMPGGGRAEDLPAELARVRSRLQPLEELVELRRRHDIAVARVAELTEEAGRTAVSAGFADLTEAAAARLAEAARAEAAGFLEERERLAAACSAVLAEEQVAALPDEVVPDVAAADQVLAAAEADAGAADRRRHGLEERCAALRAQVVRLAAELDRWTPVREAADRADGMAKLVRGTGGDNQLQMRLSAYVLATRLDQVLAAANERLAHMRDQRYLLHRTDKAHRKGSQAGLGLEVLDQWTGDVRDPATLSGGETFVISLALALGLADVVSHEAGGTEIETLFVDEGFGTLDADTLDDVMDRLDALRAGGRSVGVVSHVTELRSRIPTQLHVHKSPTGSSVHAGSLVG